MLVESIPSVHVTLQSDGDAATGSLAHSAPTTRHSASVSSGSTGGGAPAAHPRHDGLPCHAAVPGIAPPYLPLHLHYR